jgi:hypothetical protein
MPSRVVGIVVFVNNKEKGQHAQPPFSRPFLNKTAARPLTFSYAGSSGGVFFSYGG